MALVTVCDFVKRTGARCSVTPTEKGSARCKSHAGKQTHSLCGACGKNWTQKANCGACNRRVYDRERLRLRRAQEKEKQVADLLESLE